jgi:phosphocarrier protein
MSGMVDIHCYDLEKSPFSPMAARTWVQELCSKVEVRRPFSENPDRTGRGEPVEPCRARLGKAAPAAPAELVAALVGRQEMIKKKAIVKNRLGIHARPAALLVHGASKFKADIFLSKGEVQRINGKSIMGVMMLAAEQGAEITVETEGEDAAEAVAVVTALLESNFEDQA